MIKTVQRKRVEVLVDQPLLRHIRQLAEDAGITGHTVMPTLGGAGGGGRWRDDQVTGGAGQRVIFSTITSDEKADALIEKLAPLLDDYSLVVASWDVEVVRPDKF